MDWQTLRARLADPFRLTPRDDGPTHRLARALFTRGVAATAIVAFLSLWSQLDGLAGERGIVPSTPLVKRLWELKGMEAVARSPSLFWLAPSDATLHGLCAIGLASALLATAGVAQGPALLVVFATYLSLREVVQPFLGFQWDILLCEAALLGALVAPWRLWARGAPDPSPLGITLVRWLYLRLMFFSGAVKWWSGDPAWRDLSALDWHYWTQPLPNPLSWWFHRLPGHGVSAAATLVIEVGLPWIGLFGGRPAVLTFAGGCLLMGMLELTGNFGFFQLLTVAIACALLDDAEWRRLLPRRVRGALDTPDGPPPGRGRVAVAVIGVALFALSAIRVWGDTAGWDALPDRARTIAARTGPVVASYGPFRVMTKARAEVELQGSRDGRTWTAYAFRYKVGDVGRPPPLVAPHMPRLDWQMWFLPAFGRDGALLPDDWQTCERHPWLLHLMERLLDGSAPVLGLLASDPFDGRPPAFVRARMWDYRPASPGTGAWWERDRERPFCPPLHRPPEESP